MIDRSRLIRAFAIPAVFGTVSLVRMLGKPTFETIRTVDAVQLIGTGMCFGAAIFALVLFLRSPRTS
jgi:hypothetical protein